MSIFENYEDIPQPVRAVKMTQNLYDRLAKMHNGELTAPGDWDVSEMAEMAELVWLLNNRVCVAANNTEIRVGDWLVIDGDGDLYAMTEDHFQKYFRKIEVKNE